VASQRYSGSLFNFPKLTVLYDKLSPRTMLCAPSDLVMDEFLADYLRQLRERPPKCIASFRRKLIERSLGTFDVTLAYSLACECGSDSGVLLGYPLSSLSPDYDGEMFVGPLTFRCRGCDSSVIVIDTNTDGYHGMMDSAATYRGSGDSSAFACLSCGSDVLRPFVAFGYGDAVFDLDEDEPGIDYENYFMGFAAYGQCASCNTESEVMVCDL